MLDNYNDQTRRLFCNENKTLKRELDEKDTLLSQETKKQDQLQNLVSYDHKRPLGYQRCVNIPYIDLLGLAGKIY